MTAKTIGVLVFLLALGAQACLSPAAVRVTGQSAQSLEIEFELGGIKDVKDASGGWAGLEVDGFASAFDSSLGLYAPVRSYLVAIPIGGEVTCRVIDPVYRDIPMAGAGRLAEGGSLGLVGARPAEIAAKGYLGNQLAATLRVTPLVYDAAGGLRLCTRFRARLDFGSSEAVGASPAVSSGRETSYEATLRSALLNYEQGKQWRRRPVAALAASDYFTSSSSWVKITVDTTGVYCLTGRDLADLGVPLSSVSAQTLRLYSGSGQPLHEILIHPNPSWMRQVPIRVSRATGALASGDSIIFYALGGRDWTDLYSPGAASDRYTKSFYSDINCYWLTWGGSFQESPRRVATVPAPPCQGCDPYTPVSFRERLHVEYDNLHDVAVAAEDGWYWRPLIKGNSALLAAKTPAPDASKPARVRVRVADYSLGRDCAGRCFRVILRLNSSAIGDWIWPASSGSMAVVDLDTTVTIANASLQRIDVDMPLGLPPDTICTELCDKLYLAWYELAYWRKFVADGGALYFPGPDTTATVKYEISGFSAGSVYVFDVTDQFAVTQLAGSQVSGGPVYSVAILDTTTEGAPRRYAVVTPQAMRRPLATSLPEIAGIRNQSGAEYLVITHPDLIEPATTLADFHDGQVVTMNQIYDEFSWGVPDATAIRDFLRWRLTHGTPLARVLFFGDASWDIKGYLTYGTFRNFVPTYERRFLPPVSNAYSTDDWLVYLEPAPGDSYAYWPTLPFSRIPASSREEGEGMVARTIDYLTDPEMGIWQNKIMLVADDDRIGTSCPSDRSNDLHTIYAEQLSDLAFPQIFDRAKVYLTEYPIESTGLKTLARKAFLKNLNEGVLLVNYVGHGDQYRLAQEEVFNPVSVDLVATGRKLAFFVAASCNVSRFDEPDVSSMAEELFARSQGGTVGSLASTHLCLPTPNQVLNINFIFQLFDSTHSVHPTRYIADAMQVAKALTVGPARYMSYWTNNEMYALFGDPALQLATPELKVVLSPAGTDTLRRRAPYHFTGSVRTGSGAATSFDGSVDIRVKEAENTDGYTTCQGNHLSYEVPGSDVYRGEDTVADGAIGFDAFIPVDAREGVRGAVRCFVTNGQVSGAGLLDSLEIRGETPWEDNVGPDISLSAGGRTLESGDTLVAGQHLVIGLADESGVAVKGKSRFIPGLSMVIDGGERTDLTDSVYAVGGGFTESVAGFEVPGLAVDSHVFSITAFDNVNNVATRDFTLLVGSSGGQAANVVYAYPNPAADFCYVICESSRLVQVEVAVFTVSGRKIWEHASPDPRSYHQIRWEGADTEGDKVANGTYLVKVEARDPADSGFSFSKTIVVALVR